MHGGKRLYIGPVILKINKTENEKQVFFHNKYSFTMPQALISSDTTDNIILQQYTGAWTLDTGFTILQQYWSWVHMIALFHVVTDKTLTFAILHQIITTSESAQNKTSHFSDQGSCQSDTQNILLSGKWFSTNCQTQSEHVPVSLFKFKF